MKNEKVSQLTKELYWIKRRITHYNNVLSDLKYKLYLKRQKLNGANWWSDQYSCDMYNADITHIKNQIQSVRLELAKEDTKAKEYKLKIKMYNKEKYCV